MSKHHFFFSNKPYEYAAAHYLKTDGNTGLVVPAIPNAKALAFWVQADDNGQYGSFLVDFRDNGSGYWWARTGAEAFTDASVDGIHTNSYSAVFEPGWHKVYIVFDSIDAGFHLLCRYSNDEYFYPSKIADLTFYSRVFNDAEKNTHQSPLPTDSILAKYSGSLDQSNNLLDIAGKQMNIVTIGNIPIFTWVDFLSNYVCIKSYVCK